MRLRNIVLGSILLAVSPLVLAKEKEPVSRIDNGLPVAEQMAQVEALLVHEDYAELGADGRRQVREAIANIHRLMDGHESIQQVHPDRRVDIFNEESTINQLMTQAAADSRMICRREKTIGSKLPTQVCATAAAFRRAASDSQRMLRDRATMEPDRTKRAVGGLYNEGARIR